VVADGEVVYFYTFFHYSNDFKIALVLC